MNTIFWGYALMLGVIRIAETAFLFGNTDLDCAVSRWSDWSGPGFGKSERFRTILVPQSGNGKPCPHLTETQSSKPTIKKTAESFNKNFLRRNEVQPRDLLFILDSSGSIGLKDFQNAKKNLNILISKLCPPGDPFHSAGHEQFHQAGLLTFSTIVKEDFDFNDRKGLASIQQGISAATFLNQNTCTNKAFDYARAMFARNDKGVRKTNVKKEALILTDGKSNCGNATAAAKKLQDSGIDVYALAIKINDQISKEEIEGYVSTPPGNHLFALPGFNNLKELTDEVISYANTVQCVAIAPGK